ncbi:antibiotic biosynthesis monooxygenase [Ferrovibrio xuzhouensis]|uniref:Antibiotic biosynthesis monooxygenase n=1 Tax=Ferrovibrio xuzhouensis TaxID=1576914 RepID=A0ABV7VFP0_9PROT
MIARIWRGWATGGNVAAYRRHFEEIVQPHLAELPGFCGCLLLEGVAGAETEITAITLWRSLDDIRAFAGTDIAVARVEPAARAVLDRFSETAEHREVSTAVWPR